MKKSSLLIIFLSLLLSNCSLYKMDIQQGNILSSETVAQLKTGMSKAEVATLLGTSLLQDNFRSNRWDYVYFSKKGRAAAFKKSVTLIFKNEQLVNIKN